MKTKKKLQRPRQSPDLWEIENRNQKRRLRTMAKCAMQCEIFSRVVGYHRPVGQWNKGKREEFKDRVEFDEGKSLCSCKATRGFPKTEMEMKNKFTF